MTPSAFRLSIPVALILVLAYCGAVHAQGATPPASEPEPTATGADTPARDYRQPLGELGGGGEGADEDPLAAYRVNPRTGEGYGGGDRFANEPPLGGIFAVLSGFGATGDGAAIEGISTWGARLGVSLHLDQRLPDAYVVHNAYTVLLGLDRLRTHSPDPGNDVMVPTLGLHTLRRNRVVGIEFGGLFFHHDLHGGGFAAIVFGLDNRASIRDWGIASVFRGGLFAVGGGGVFGEWEFTVSVVPTRWLMLDAGFEWATYQFNANGPDFREVIFRLYLGATLWFRL